MIAAAALAGAVTVAATAVVLWAARRFGIVDVPDRRSSHVRPTPTLGGLAIVAGVAAGCAAGPPLPGSVLRAVGLGLAILLLAAWDDVGRPMGVGGKLALQVLAAAVWVVFGPPLETVTLPLVGLVPLGGGWGSALAALWLLWLMNVFNFMDGIDGLTATQTVVIGGAQSCCLAALGSPVAPLPLFVAAAAAGFLPFNRPPARLFMGDVGSLSIGFVVGAGALAAAPAGLPLWWLAMPLTYYAVDTAHTLLRRAWRGENLLRAHREHLYQRLVQAGWSHGAVDGVALVGTALFALAACLGVRGAVAAALVAATPAAALLGAGLFWKERRYGG